MAFELRYSPEALDDLKQLRKFDSTAILDQIQRVLAADPTQETRSGVKLLRQPAPAQYRLRVGEFRVFYDVGEDYVNVIRVLSKEDALTYLGSE